MKHPDDRELTEELALFGRIVNEGKDKVKVIMLSGDLFIEAADKIKRLRAAGDKLAEAHIDDLCDCDQPECVTIREAHAAWQEARRG